LARTALYAADMATAREHTRQIAERMARGVAAGERDTALEGGPKVLFQMVELSLCDATSEDWQQLLARARSIELQPMEEIELIERASLEALHRGDYEQGRALYAQARQVCEQKPNLMSERVEARLAPLFAAAT
jgi:hypothetical protein